MPSDRINPLHHARVNKGCYKLSIAIGDTEGAKHYHMKACYFYARYKGIWHPALEQNPDRCIDAGGSGKDCFCYECDDYGYGVPNNTNPYMTFDQQVEHYLDQRGKC